MRTLFIKLVIPFFLVGCGGQVKNGQTDPHLELARNYPGVVKVGRNGGDGTLVYPGWILTAAHVAEGMHKKHGDALYVFFKEDSVRVKHVFLHPAFTPMGDADIALLQLEEETKGIPYYPLYVQKQELNQKITVVGHGNKRRRDGTWIQDGQKRAFTNTVDEVNEHYLIFDYSSPEDNPTDLEWTCGPGDSGGPAFVKLGEQDYLAGVSSKGEPGVEGKASYGSREYFVRVSAYANWLNETMQNPDIRLAYPGNKSGQGQPVGSHDSLIQTITAAFEHFTEEGMREAIASVYAKHILEKRTPEQIMANMPAMMRELPGCKYLRTVSSNHTNVLLEMQKGDVIYHLELFFSPIEPGKIEQMAFGRL